MTAHLTSQGAQPSRHAGVDRYTTSFINLLPMANWERQVSEAFSTT